jgi:hypothetical protein
VNCLPPTKGEFISLWGLGRLCYFLPAFGRGILFTRSCKFYQDSQKLASFWDNARPSSIVRLSSSSNCYFTAALSARAGRGNYHATDGP